MQQQCKTSADYQPLRACSTFGAHALAGCGHLGWAAGAKCVCTDCLRKPLPTFHAMCCDLLAICAGARKA
jgi:hypothetical protein